MAVRSVIDVDIQSAAFERFQKLFDSYSEKLRKQPDLWRKINAEHERLAQGFARFGTKMDEHLGALQELKTLEVDQEKSLERSGAIWSGIEQSSRHTARNVLHATGSLLKWTGIFSGITGLLGYLTLGGISELGGDVFSYRKSASGLGVSIGQERAFDIAFKRLLGSPSSFLGGINTAVTNVAEQGPLLALGVNPNGSTGHVAIKTLERLRSLAMSTPTNQLGILEQMYRLGNLGISVEDLRRLKSMSGPEYAQLLGTYRTQERALGIGSGAALAWTNFVTTMDLAKAKIENVFVRGLEPLSGPIANLTSAFSDLLSALMKKNGPIAQDIDAIASWMKSFNGKITQPKFLLGLERFVDTIARLGNIAHDASHPLAWAKSYTRWGLPLGLQLNNPGNLKFAGQAGAVMGPHGFARFSSLSGGFHAMANQLELYRARGIDTVQGIVSTYAPAGDKNDVPAYIREVDKELHVKSTEHLNLANPHILAALMRAMIHEELGHNQTFGGDISKAARDTLARSGIIVRVENNTGGSATASIAPIGASR